MSDPCSTLSENTAASGGGCTFSGSVVLLQVSREDLQGAREKTGGDVVFVLQAFVHIHIYVYMYIHTYSMWPGGKGRRVEMKKH